MTTLFNRSNHGGQDEDKTLLQRSQRCHKGEFRHVSISARQRSLRCGRNLRGAFLRATLPMAVGSCARAMANPETKGLKFYHQGEFLHNYYMFVSLHDSDHEGVFRIFVALSYELWGYSINYIRLYYTAGVYSERTMNLPKICVKF